MLERAELILKITCALLAVVLLSKLAGMGGNSDLLNDVVVPSIPESTRPDEKADAPKKGSPPRPSSSRSSAAALPRAIQARVARVKSSEVFGAIPRPLPMALMGIAGDSVILRGPNGREGLVKEGGTHDGVKLLKIGINRILIEHEGQKKELTLHRGFGSESLLKK